MDIRRIEPQLSKQMSVGTGRHIVARANVYPLRRLFVKETGLTFGAWRQQARLLKALEWLAAGRPVTAIALDLGYESPSAFIAMFRRAFGVPPGRYLKGR